MQDMLRKSMTVGFAFGIFFSVIAYLGRFPIDHSSLWIIPFFAAILCGIGTIIAVFVSNFLTSKGLSNSVKAKIIGFIVAAIINYLILLMILTYSGEAKLHSEIVLVLILGIAMGGIYGIYTNKVSTLNEKMQFLEDLADKNRKLQQASRKLAIIEERNRMSRELHDSISQGLHAIIFTIHSLRNEFTNPPQRIYDILSHMEATANSTLDELQNMIEELKPSLLAEEGLEETLKVTMNLFSQRKIIPVEIQLQLPELLSPEIEMTIYRITQEALCNIEKHAYAQHVSLKVSCDIKKLILTISDDGIGFDTHIPLSGNGLENMRKRVEDIGGTLDIASKLGVGTSIIAKFTQKG